MTGAYGPRTLAVIAGSGLAGVADGFEADDVIPFARIPGVGAATVAGHEGVVRVGRMGMLRCALVMGRRHFYEGAVAGVDALVSWLAGWGATDLIACSAAGGLSPSQTPGDVIVVRDVVDMHYPRTRPASAAGIMRLDPGLTADVEAAARACEIAVARGTLVCGAGPAYETRAEVGFLQWVGGDLVTMSSAPEIASANRHGLRAAALGVITNPATGIDGAVPRHDEVLTVAEHAARRIGRLIERLAAGWPIEEKS